MSYDTRRATCGISFNPVQLTKCSLKHQNYFHKLNIEQGKAIGAPPAMTGPSGFDSHPELIFILNSRVGDNSAL
jgi:hypothetical protein